MNFINTNESHKQNDIEDKTAVENKAFLDVPIELESGIFILNDLDLG